MTANQEDYLKMIYELGGYGGQVTNKQIAEGLHVSAASVSEMLQKLVKDGYIIYTPYKGIQLTKSGATKAASLLRKHRLWEVFLVEHLQYSWSDVDEVAELLEHVTSNDLADRLERYLDYPPVCPHGSPIPYEARYLEDASIPLAALNQGQKAVIRRVVDEKELLDYLNRLGIKIGDVVEVVTIEPYEGPMILNIGHDRTISMSYKAAQSIYCY